MRVALLTIVAVTIVILLNTLLVQMAWNWGIVPAVSVAKEIDYHTAFWVNMLVYMVKPDRSSKDA